MIKGMLLKKRKNNFLKITVLFFDEAQRYRKYGFGITTWHFFNN